MAAPITDAPKDSMISGDNINPNFANGSSRCLFLNNLYRRHTKNNDLVILFLGSMDTEVIASDQSCVNIGLMEGHGSVIS